MALCEDLPRLAQGLRLRQAVDVVQIIVRMRLELIQERGLALRSHAQEPGFELGEILFHLFEQKAVHRVVIRLGIDRSGGVQISLEIRFADGDEIERQNGFPKHHVLSARPVEIEKV